MGVLSSLNPREKALLRQLAALPFTALCLLPGWCGRVLSRCRVGLCLPLSAVLGDPWGHSSKGGLPGQAIRVGSPSPTEAMGCHWCSRARCCCSRPRCCCSRLRCCSSCSRPRCCCSRPPCCCRRPRCCCSRPRCCCSRPPCCCSRPRCCRSRPQCCCSRPRCCRSRPSAVAGGPGAVAGGPGAVAGGPGAVAAGPVLLQVAPVLLQPVPGSPVTAPRLTITVVTPETGVTAITVVAAAQAHNCTVVGRVAAGPTGPKGSRRGWRRI